MSFGKSVTFIKVPIIISIVISFTAKTIKKIYVVIASNIPTISRAP